jgi:hypothetical protein
MGASFYKLGVELALCDSGLQKFSSVIGDLARSAVKSVAMSETRDILGVETPEWKRVSPFDVAVDAAKDVVEKITGPEEPEPTAPEAPPQVPPETVVEAPPEKKPEKKLE